MGNDIHKQIGTGVVDRPARRAKCAGRFALFVMVTTYAAVLCLVHFVVFYCIYCIHRFLFAHVLRPAVANPVSMLALSLFSSTGLPYPFPFVLGLPYPFPFTSLKIYNKQHTCETR